MMIVVLDSAAEDIKTGFALEGRLEQTATKVTKERRLHSSVSLFASVYISGARGAERLT
jgi:hypothetical protein